MGIYPKVWIFQSQLHRTAWLSNKYARCPPTLYLFYGNKNKIEVKDCTPLYEAYAVSNFSSNVPSINAMRCPSLNPLMTRGGMKSDVGCFGAEGAVFDLCAAFKVEGEHRPSGKNTVVKFSLCNIGGTKLCVDKLAIDKDAVAQTGIDQRSC